MAKAQDIERARRFARTIASELGLYHGKLFDEGIRQDALFELARVELEAGRALYVSRVLPRVDPEQHLYWQAIVDVIIYPRMRIPSAIW